LPSLPDEDVPASTRPVERLGPIQWAETAGPTRLRARQNRQNAPRGQGTIALKITAARGAGQASRWGKFPPALAAAAFLWMALEHDAALVPSVIVGPLVRRARRAIDGLRAVQRRILRRGSRFGSTTRQVAFAAYRRSDCCRGGVICVRLPTLPFGCRCSIGRGRHRGRIHPQADRRAGAGIKLRIEVPGPLASNTR
jgi:hypothetical protein